MRFCYAGAHLDVGPFTYYGQLLRLGLSLIKGTSLRRTLTRSRARWSFSQACSNFLRSVSSSC